MLVSIGLIFGMLINVGVIVVNGVVVGMLFVNVGMLVVNIVVIVINMGMIMLNGVNGIGIMVVGIGMNVMVVMLIGMINVVGGFDFVLGMCNYGVWVEGLFVKVMFDGVLNLMGVGVIGVYVCLGVMIDVGVNVVLVFMFGIN